MLDTVLASPKASELRVLVVWLPMFPGDSRPGAARAVALVDDPRVTHVWDGARAAGRWFMRVVADVPRLAGRRVFRFGVVWDTYLLYGPEAGWRARGPAPLLVAGAPVVHDKTQLAGHFGISRSWRKTSR